MPLGDGTGPPDGNGPMSGRGRLADRCPGLSTKSSSSWLWLALKIVGGIVVLAIPLITRAIERRSRIVS